ncbi:MAG: biopolymer transporter ExbD [Dinghuibacter sp.]|nr:biopolymer transporter ExbD [Dinghuibacter sp.]
MPKVTLPRKSTAVDMTAMCDVAFLLLSFFIFTAKFKENKSVEVTTPTSVSTTPIDAKNSINVSIDKDGKVYIGISPDERRKELAAKLNTSAALGLTDAELKAFANQPEIGVPFPKMKSFLGIVAGDPAAKVAQEGIPTDSTSGELARWIAASKEIFPSAEDSLAIFLRVDNKSKFTVTQAVIDAFRKTNTFKFKLVTQPEDVPIGSELWRENREGKTEKETN